MIQRTRERGRAGFTLIELLIAAYLVALSGAAVYQVFAQGVRLWNYAYHDQSGLEVALWMEQLGHDLRNASFCTVDPFVGQANSIEFCSANHLNTKRLSRGGSSELVRVRHQFDPSSKRIVRGVRSWAEILFSKWGAIQNHLAVENVKACKFSFYTGGDKGKDDWLNRWPHRCLPVAVRMMVEYGSTNRLSTMTKTVWIPTGGCSKVGD